MVISTIVGSSGATRSGLIDPARFPGWDRRLIIFMQMRTSGLILFDDLSMPRLDFN